MDLQMEFKLFLRALMHYGSDPTPTMQLEIQRRAFHLEMAFREHEIDLEKRITTKLLESLSARLETNGAVKEIDSLRKAIDQLGK